MLDVELHAIAERGFHALHRADFTGAEAAFRTVLARREDHELASLGLFHTLGACNRWDDALSEALRFVRLADSEDYRELFDGAFLDDVSPGLRTLADEVRVLFRARDEWSVMSAAQRAAHASWGAFVGARAITARS
ncbi:MAG TPA: hypothetical protein VM513_05180 [Kofleriaceae bacterium]|jgi:hypothetical protein|nr:hypothetical protein [Kofleriaceae bacterium]